MAVKETVAGRQSGANLSPVTTRWLSLALEGSENTQRPFIGTDQSPLLATKRSSADVELGPLIPQQQTFELFTLA